MKREAYIPVLISSVFVVLACGVMEIRPTSTPVVIIITATPQPTPTLISTQIPQSTSTVIALVFGDSYGIKVINVDKVDSYLGGSTFPLLPVYPETGNVFLKIKVVFFKQGEPIWDWDKSWATPFAIIDSEGKKYLPEGKLELDGTSKDLQGSELNYTNLAFYFSVLKTAFGFKLQFRDLPLIDLEQ
jgi:hypothetical protein